MEGKSGEKLFGRNMVTEPEHTGEQESKSMFGFEIWKGYRRDQ